VTSGRMVLMEPHVRLGDYRSYIGALTVSQAFKPSLGLKTRCFLLFGSCCSALWGALSDEKTSLSFVSHSLLAARQSSVCI
jgi:hypothetical protein